MSNTSFNKLLQSGNIGRVRTKNRIIRTAAGTDYLDEGSFSLNAKQVPFYEALARGGVGLIIIGAAVVDFPIGTVIATQVRMDDDKFIPSWSEVTRTIHKYDCPAFMQFMHAGAWHGIFGDGLQGVTASAMSRSELAAMGIDFGMPTRELTVPEIEKIENQFVDAAERAKKAGFDGVEISVATCHLGNSFLSRAWNKRHDEYGVDSYENRTRFAAEIIGEAKRRLGRDFPVGVLINGAEYGIPNGITIEEGQAFARILEKAGVDHLHVRGMGYGEYDDLHIPDSIFFPEPPSPLGKPLDGSRSGPGVVAPLAAEIKKVVAVPVIAVGRLDPELGEALLEQGKADFIAMQRRLIADPELPNKVKEGRLDDIAPCTACLNCFSLMDRKLPVQCRINAAIGGTKDYRIEKADKKKKVVVIGGGPGGMEAARVAALKGHEVILFEKERRLGGLMSLASLVKNADIENLDDIIKYLKIQITKLGVKVKLGKQVTAADIEKLHPDAVIVSTGGTPVAPEIPGIESSKVITMPKLHHMMKNYLKVLKLGTIKSLTKLWMPIGKKVVIMGGGIQGYELAEFLVKSGRNITIAATENSLRDPRWAPVQNNRMLAWLYKKQVMMLTGVKYERITEKGLDIVTKDGKQQILEADSIIPVSPLASNKELYDSLCGKAPQVYAIGDCDEAGLIIDAIAGGYRVAREL